MRPTPVPQETVAIHSRIEPPWVLALALAFAAMTSGAPAAADVWTRGAAVDRAMAEENPQVAAARAKEAAAQAQGRQAGAARAPMVLVDLGIGPALRAELIPGAEVLSTESGFSDFSADDLSVVFGAEVRIIQPLYTFGKIRYRRSAAEHSEKARAAQTSMTRAEVALAVARLYEQYLFARDAVLFFEEIDHTLDRSIASTRELLDADKPEVSEQDLARLESARSAGRMALEQARAGVSQAEGGLRAYLGIPDDEPFEVAEQELAPLSAPRVERAELVGISLAERPEIAGLGHGSAAYSDLAAAERAGYLPDLFLMGYLSAAYTPGRDDLPTRFVTDSLNHVVPGLILGLRWTWQGGMSGARAAEIRAEATRLARLREWALAGIPAEVRKAHEDMRRALADLDHAAEGVKGAKQWVVRASADYAIGLGDSRSVTDAVSAYALLRMGQMEAEMRLNIALAELDKATGRMTDPTRRFYR